jgi:spore maturation protein CgeB
MAKSFSIVFLGLSITSSWGNGHATTYRALVRELCRRGHEVLFLERDLPWYAAHRDLPRPPYGRTELYGSLDELTTRFSADVQEADAVVVGSYVPEGASVGEWVLGSAKGIKAFYDIDTPVTLAKLTRGDEEYLTPALIPHFDLYLSFSGGPALERLEKNYGARTARPLYCAVDSELYHPQASIARWDLGYMGTYSEDRQPFLERLLLAPAELWRQGRFVVAGPQYPADIDWPANVTRIDHLPPAEHRSFYNAQRFTLNLTRADMVRLGYSPSVRLFEAAACAVPVIGDDWPGLETFFEPGKEILIARNAGDVLYYLRDLPERERHKIGERARARVLAEHTAAQRAAALEGYLEACRG